MKLTAAENALAWAIERYGAPEVLAWVPEATRYNVERALAQGKPTARPTPQERLRSGLGGDRDARAALRRRLPGHWRHALDRAMSHRGEWTARDAIVVEFLCARLTTSAAAPADALDGWGDLHETLGRKGLEACGVALAGVDGRAFARALRSFDVDQQPVIRRGRERRLDDGAAAVIRDAWVGLATSHADPSDRARMLGMYVIAFAIADDRLAEQQAAVTTRLAAADRPAFAEFLRRASRSSRRAHAAALYAFVTGDADD